MRLVGWNGFLICAGLATIALLGEAFLRLTVPFLPMHSKEPAHFHPQAGLIGTPGATEFWTDGSEFWTVSQVNSLGFLDREPPNPEQAAGSCHVAVVGDSFVEAGQVPVSAKLQVALERLAAKSLPHFNLSASAFGRRGTGQINQLGYYDAFARHLHPKLVVLVFTPNDLIDNFPLWMGLRRGLNPRHLPFVSAVRGEGEGMAMHLLPPDPEWRKFRLELIADSRPSGMARNFLDTSLSRAWKRIRGWSWFLEWLLWKRSLAWPSDREALFRANADLLRREPDHAALLADWVPVSRRIFPSQESQVPSFFAMFARDELPLFFRTALEFTAFGLDEFRDRARRDGFSLAVLATHRTTWHGGGVLRLLREMAERRGIPVIDLSDYIRRQGAGQRAAVFAQDGHWNAASHQWAAEAVLEFIEERQEICGH